MWGNKPSRVQFVYEEELIIEFHEETRLITGCVRPPASAQTAKAIDRLPIPPDSAPIRPNRPGEGAGAAVGGFFAGLIGGFRVAWAAITGKT